MDLLPEDLELTHFQQICQVENSLDLWVLLNFLGEETLAKNKICVGEVGQGLQENLEYSDVFHK